eukprot:jgi/Tetstr1/429514/TSEL_019419.t1
MEPRSGTYWASMSSYYMGQAASRGGGGGGKKYGGTGRGEAAAKAEVLRCAACRVDSQGEVSFLQHINGRAHTSKARRKGFAGLLPNDMGVVPELRSPELRAAAAAFGHRPSGGGAGGGRPTPWTPEVRTVSLPRGVEDTLEDTLERLPPVTFPQRRGGGREGARKRSGGGGRADGGVVPPAVRGGGPFARQRDQLPVAAYRRQLLEALREPACIIEGETGSGKTTQVAQYLLEEAAATGSPVSVICTQPRRISAIGVAERVAAERGEGVGGTVGYSIRGESRAGPGTALLFCTTGVLLRRLEEDPALEGVTHVLVDEVHERSLESDFLLLTLRRLLETQRRAGLEGRGPRLHLALMSATMDSSVLSAYFGDCPRVSFPGRAFPVTPLYLEHALRLTRHHVDRSADWCRHSQVAAKRLAQRLAAASDSAGPPAPMPSERDYATRFPRFPPDVHAALADLDLDAINTRLIAELVSWFLRLGGVERALEAVGAPASGRQTGGGEGTAVLVFLPGTREIQDVQDALLALPELGRDPVQRGWVLPLHGSLPAEDQRKVFDRPPPGVVKVVLATNVAETSITIDDVGFVIDSGRVKEERYDAERRMGSLEDVLVSAAAAKQRRGRAGRVSEGLCVHLYPSDARQAAYQEPEVRRVALQQLVMRTKALRLPGRAGDICEELPEPPSHQAVVSAVHELEAIGALTLQDGEEELTPLGELLVKLPIDARLGKLIVYGLCFGAGDEALTMAAALGSRSPFLSPMERREEADRCKKEFAGNTQSDHLAVLRAYNRFDSLAGEERFQFARSRFLGVKTLQAIAQLKRQLLETLSHAGMVPHGLRSHYVESLGRRYNGGDGCLIALGEERKPAPPEELLTALLAAALYPSVAFVNSVPAKNSSGKANKAATTLNIRDADTSAPAPQLATVHPSSVNSAVAAVEWRTPFLAFHERVKTTKVYVRDCTPVPPLALMIFGGGVVTSSDVGGGGGHYGGEAALCMDEWFTLNVMPRRAADIVLEVRRRTDALLAHMVEGQALHGGERGEWDHADDAEKAALVGTVVALSRLEVMSEEQKRRMGMPSSNVSGGGGGKKKNKGSKGRKGSGNANTHPLGARGGVHGKSGRSSWCPW